MRRVTLRLTAALAFAACMSACTTAPTERGIVTIQGRGTVGLSRDGDPLLGTGRYAEKRVPKPFAEGYAKGISDQVQREYDQLQDEISRRPAPAPAPQPTPQGSTYSPARDGQTHDYQMTLPERIDPRTGVKLAPQPITVPIDE